jgi:hypothetical protein
MDKPNHPPHPRAISSGSSTVMIDGKPAAMSGSAVNCGGTVNCGGSVNIGDTPGSTSASAISSMKKVTQAAASSTSQTVQMDPDNMYWPPYNFLAEDGKKEIKVEYVKPITSIAVLSIEEAREFYQSLGGKDTVGDIKNYGDLAKGSAEAYTTAKGLGSLGVKAYTKNINGKDWIIIKDFKRHRQTLMKGTQWSATNPKVVQMGLGLNDLHGAVRYVRFNVGIEIAFAIGVNAADYIMRDEATLSEFVGNSAGDMVKGFISLAGAAVLTAVLIPATFSILATGIVFAFLSFGIGQWIDNVDKENGYSNEISEAVKRHFQ